MTTDKKTPAGMANAYEEHARILTMPTDSGWQKRHQAAWDREGYHGGLRAKNHERALSMMIQGWLLYADAHREAFENTIGEDGVLGPEWEQVGRGLRGLLNGEAGRFDCGTLDAIIMNALLAEGFEEAR